MVITIGSPAALNGREGRREMATFYGELLGMQVVSEGWLKIAAEPGSPFEFALDGDGWSDQRPPRWRDPDYPQQMHIDVAVADLETAGKLVVELGGSLLEEVGPHHVYADLAGHPFCLYPEPDRPNAPPTKVVRLVFDCFSPRALAHFYEGLLGISTRLVDEPDRVVLDIDDERFPNLSFQQAQFVASRWPDPAYPAQLHVDWRFTDGREAAIERAEQLGAVVLPKLADTAIYADPAGHPFCL